MARFISGLERQFELKNGSVVELDIGVNRVREAYLRDQNLPVPQAIRITGLIDTGSTASCIDSKYIAQLSLETNGYIRCRTAGGLRFPPVCNLKLSLPLSDEVCWAVDYHPCAAFNNLSATGDSALIGEWRLVSA